MSLFNHQQVEEPVSEVDGVSQQKIGHLISQSTHYHLQDKNIIHIGKELHPPPRQI